MESQVATWLSNSLSPDANTRTQATQSLDDLFTRDHSNYVFSLSQILSSTEHTVGLRTTAGLSLKNTLTSREYPRQTELAKAWRELSEDIRTNIKSRSLHSLTDSEKAIRNASAQIIAAIAAIEVPAGMWPELIGTLLQGINDSRTRGDDGAVLRQSMLQCLGFVCEQIKSDVLAAQSNDILTCVVQSVKEETKVDVQLAAIHALYNSLEFIKENFEREGERNYIMQVVCEATQIANADVQLVAFECLVRIMQLYYEKMKFYMERALFGLTVLGMKHTDERIAIQAVEFWSTVCDEELELSLEAEEAAEYGDQPERQSYGFARVALPEILPVLLQLLGRQEEDASEDEWNLAMAAGTCLSLLAQVTGDVIVAPIIPFVETHIKATDWRQREAAVMAFGSILDGPNPQILSPLVQQALPVLVEMMQDQNNHVKDSTAWTLGRICDYMVESVQNIPGAVGHLVQAFLGALDAGVQDGEGRVVTNSCWALMNLIEQLGGSTKDTSILTPFYDPLATSLFKFANRNTNESNCRDSAYETLASLAGNAPVDCLTLVHKILHGIIEQMERVMTFHDQLVGIDDKTNWNQIQINCCCVLTACIRRLGKDIKNLQPERVMTVLLSLLQISGRSSPVQEDIFLAIGALTLSLEQDFHPYLPAFLPFLFAALQNHEEYQLCSIGVGLIGDVCRALGDASVQYCQNFLEVLMQDLQSPVLHRSVKPPILSCFGDIAMSIGGSYVPFLESTMTVLQQAGAMRADPNNFDLVDYINTLREGILEAYTGIVSGLKTAGKAESLLPYMPSVFTFLHLALTDQDRPESILVAAIGLIGDLAEAFSEGQLKDILSSAWIDQIFKTGKLRLADQHKKKVLKWAREMVRRATQ
ncbi:ARM repeat-containing protein [Atractiella rhizophila]|nr:ARM repeat-containing protein [Atractiella rhizophila]